MNHLETSKKTNLQFTYPCLGGSFETINLLADKCTSKRRGEEAEAYLRMFVFKKVQAHYKKSRSGPADTAWKNFFTLTKRIMQTPYEMPFCLFARLVSDHDWDTAWVQGLTNTCFPYNLTWDSEATWYPIIEDNIMNPVGINSSLCNTHVPLQTNT
ncbi:hypothetical protein CEXT_88611 [Caerostris extrusa]|uniref:Uncharacterized protein n=1 Tax=Caerostris extrusa TaxID=172846 RepID=A0AAV4TLU6_CAEEX|nr:hypothetical protein CEXT_88611 [Caerostris extrusa]